MEMFERKQTILDNEDVLHDDYRPDKIEERDEELEMYKSCLLPVINGNQPRNIFLYGKTGVGKTATTKYLLSHLEEDSKKYDDIDLNIIYMNCEDLTSSYRVAVNLVNELRSVKNQVSETGYPLSAIYSMLWQDLDSLESQIIIVLDEIDYISGDDSILYQIPRARTNRNLEKSRVGIIGISNDFKFREMLDPRAEDTLCEREIHFSPYDAKELQNILSRRSKLAFKSDVLASGVIELCSAIAASDKGSARQALDLLLESGHIARRQDDELVTISHVEQAKLLLRKQQVEKSLRDLTVNDHLTLVSMVLAEIDESENVPVRRGIIFEKYLSLTEEIKNEALGERAFHNHLSELTMLGVLDRYERNEGRNGGIYYQYELGMPIESVFSALEDIHFSFDIDVEDLKDRARYKGII